jgi:hypothetical protein
MKLSSHSFKVTQNFTGQNAKITMELTKIALVVVVIVHRGCFFKLFNHVHKVEQGFISSTAATTLFLKL